MVWRIVVDETVVEFSLVAILIDAFMNDNE